MIAAHIVNKTKITSLKAILKWRNAQQIAEMKKKYFYDVL